MSQRPYAPARVLAYARVSGQEQARTGTSLAGQRDEIEAWCKSRGYPSPRIYVEVESGSGEAVERRGEQLRLTAEARPGDIVVVTRQDRWSRDVAHFLTSTTALMKRGVRFEAVHEGFDHATPEGRFVATMHAAFSEHERAKIYGRTVVRRRQLRDQGMYIEGLPPFGYRRKDRKLAIVESDAAIVRRAFSLCARGKSLDAIIEEVGPDHGDRSCWRDRLRSRHYLGEVKDSAGAWMKANEPIVTPALWAAAQKSLDSRRKNGRAPGAVARTANWLLRRIATCADCGSPVSAQYVNARATDPVGDGYYSCRERVIRKACSCPASRVSIVDPKADALTQRRLLELRHDLAKSPPKPRHQSRASGIRARIDKLSAKRERLIDMAADGTLTRAELVRKLTAVDHERITEEARLATAEAEDAALSADVRADLLRDIEAMQRAWAKSSMPERREVVELLAERVRLRGPDVRIDWRSETDLAAQNVSAGSCF